MIITSLPACIVLKRQLRLMGKSCRYLGKNQFIGLSKGAGRVLVTVDEKSGNRQGRFCSLSVEPECQYRCPRQFVQSFFCEYFSLNHNAGRTQPSSSATSGATLLAWLIRTTCSRSRKDHSHGYDKALLTARRNIGHSSHLKNKCCCFFHLATILNLNLNPRKTVILFFVFINRGKSIKKQIQPPSLQKRLISAILF